MIQPYQHFTTNIENNVSMIKSRLQKHYGALKIFKLNSAV